MDLYKKHYILITKDFVEDVLLKGDIVYGYLAKSNKYLYIQSLANDEDFDELSALEEMYDYDGEFYKIPLKDISVDHMIPRKVDKELYVEYLRGKISSEDFYGYEKPNNGVEFNSKIELKISYLRDMLENSDDPASILDAYYDNTDYFINFDEAFDNYSLNKDDLEFKKEETTVIAFLTILDLCFDNNFKYNLEQIKESINQECDYFSGKTNDRSHLLKMIFIEKHAQEGNYYLFKEYPYLLDIFKQYLDDLIFRDDMLAIKAKAYLDYEGAFFWPANYKEAETLLLKLYNMKDYEVANTLGYLYYYHNPNGECDYNKAFMYFSIGAAFNITESRYKLADCLINGLGTPKNERVGFDLLARVYVDTRIEFTKGNQLSKYADVLVRMHDAYDRNLDSDDENFCYRRKVHCITEAKYAIEMRRNALDYIGDDIVYNKICDKYSLYEFEPLDDKIYLINDLMLREILLDIFTMTDEAKKLVKVSLKARNGEATLKIKLSERIQRQMLVTFVDYGKSILTDELVIKGKCDLNIEETSNFKNIFLFVRELDEIDHLIVAGAINAFIYEPYVILPKKLKKTGKLHKFISVLYNDQHLSDRLPVLCLADGFDLKQNDRVIVGDDFDSEEATVYKTFVLYESELEMKLNEYDRVISKKPCNSENKKLEDFVA